jgi:hypothetical protein
MVQSRILSEVTLTETAASSPKVIMSPRRHDSVRLATAIPAASSGKKSAEYRCVIKKYVRIRRACESKHAEYTARRAGALRFRRAENPRAAKSMTAQDAKVSEMVCSRHWRMNNSGRVISELIIRAYGGVSEKYPQKKPK